MAEPDLITRDPAAAIEVPIATLLANDHDPESDPLGLISVSAAMPEGATVTSFAGIVRYEPPAGFSGPGSFTYVVGDGNGGSAIGSVRVSEVPDTAEWRNRSRIARVGDSFRLFFFGVPGRIYRIQATETLNPANWQTIGAVAADELGTFQFMDTPPSDTPMRFYRTISP